MVTFATSLEEEVNVEPGSAPPSAAVVAADRLGGELEDVESSPRDV